MKKIFVFFYNKSDHQVRNYCFKKKITSDKLLMLELMQININKLTSDLCQIKIYADLEIKTSSKFLLQIC